MSDAVSLLSFSVDLELPIEQQSSDNERRLEFVTDDLLELFDEFQVPTTWAVADPVRSAATPQILAAQQRHEIAVLADQSWAGPGAGELRRTRELLRRVTVPTNCGFRVTTLALPSGEWSLDAETLATAQIETVRYSSPPPASELQRCLRMGMHVVTATKQFPEPRRWRFGFRNWQVNRAIRSLSKRKNLKTHLVVAAAKMIAAPQLARHDLQRLLRSAAHYRAVNQLQIVTLQELAAIHRPRPTPECVPAVLRPAA